jgi:archaellum biogenesis ATPase FlaH
MAEEEFDDEEEEFLADVLSSGNYEIDQKMGGGIPMD